MSKTLPTTQIVDGKRDIKIQKQFPRRHFTPSEINLSRQLLKAEINKIFITQNEAYSNRSAEHF